MFLKILFLAILLHLSSAFRPPIVQLPTGLIAGKIALSATKRPYYQFEKIPYAEPPVGPLRFKPVVPKSKWSGILNTTFLDATCWQTIDDQYPEMLEWVTEDCLFVNVYTPQLPSLFWPVSYPVIFYIHGGGFNFDAAIHHFTAPEFLIDEDVVIVTFNYRLGPWGFLSTEDNIISGNIGLKDIQFVLKWTNENIHLFGGDPKRIVMFGSSAGASAVGFQLLNKNNEGLFRGGMASSGTAISNSMFTLPTVARQMAFELASKINPSVDLKNDSSLLLEFLESVDPQTLATAANPYMFQPVLEASDANEPFLTEGMLSSLKKGDFIRVPFFLGYNSGELFTWAVDSDLVSYDQNPELLVPTGMVITDDVVKRRIGENIKNFYTRNTSFSETYLGRGDLARLLGDDMVTRSTLKYTEVYSQFADVYLYKFSYDGQLGNISTPPIPGCGSVAHAEDVHYVWCDRTCPYRDTYPKLDILTSSRLRRLFVNFVKYLNPTPFPELLLQNILVPKYTSQTRYYVNINATLEVLTDPEGDTLQFWDSQYDSLPYEVVVW